MIILQDEVIQANLADLPNYISALQGTAITATAKEKISVWPADGSDSPEYDVYFHLPMMIASAHEEWDLDFLTNLIKGLTGMVGQVATGNIEGAVINGITVTTGTIKSISQSMLVAQKTYNIPWIVPVRVKQNREYKMTATIYGDSLTFDTGITSADVDNEASIRATLFMCDTANFSSGGAVDTIQPDRLEVPQLSDKGREKNLFAGARNFTITGATSCDCTTDSRSIRTHVDPSILCKTHGSMRYKTMSYIHISQVHMHYVEKPCRERPPTGTGTTPKPPGPGTTGDGPQTQPEKPEGSGHPHHTPGPQEF